MTPNEFRFLLSCSNVQHYGTTANTLYQLLEHVAQDSVFNLCTEYLAPKYLFRIDALLSEPYCSLAIPKLTSGNKDRFANDVLSTVVHFRANPLTFQTIVRDLHESESKIHEAPLALLVLPSFRALSDSDASKALTEFHFSDPKMKQTDFVEKLSILQIRRGLLESVTAVWPKVDDSAESLDIAYRTEYDGMVEKLFAGKFDVRAKAWKTNPVLSLKVFKKELVAENCAPLPWSDGVAQDNAARKLDKASEVRFQSAPKTLLLEASVGLKALNDSEEETREGKVPKHPATPLVPSKGPSTPITPSTPTIDSSVRNGVLVLKLPIAGSTEGSSKPFLGKQPKLPAKGSCASPQLKATLDSILRMIPAQSSIFTQTLFYLEVMPGDARFTPVQSRMFGEGSIGLVVVHDPRYVARIIQSLVFAGYDCYISHGILAEQLQIAGSNTISIAIALVYFVPKSVEGGAFSVLDKIHGAAAGSGISSSFPAFTFLKKADVPPTVGNVDVDVELSAETVSEIIMRSVPRRADKSYGLILDYRPGCGTKVLAALRMAESPSVQVFFDDANHMKTVRKGLEAQLESFFESGLLGVYNDEIGTTLSVLSVEADFKSDKILTSPTGKNSTSRVKFEESSEDGSSSEIVDEENMELDTSPAKKKEKPKKKTEKKEEVKERKFKNNKDDETDKKKKKAQLKRILFNSGESDEEEGKKPKKKAKKGSSRDDSE